MTGPFLACDWGTTNVRAWVVGEDGAPGPERGFPLGVGRLRPGEASIRFREEIRPGMNAEGLPALLCGMIGSNLGWTPVAYVPCPTSMADLASGLVTVSGGEAPVRIVPGVRGPGAFGGSDVMRGEETQILGWAARHAPTGEHLVCHPGTHAKWAVVRDGRLKRFATVMTGELYAVLSRHGVLATDGADDDEAAFAEGVEAAGDGSALAARLFTGRTRVVADGRPASGTASYLSGLLVGADAATGPDLVGWSGDPRVTLIGEPVLCRRYRPALERRGWTVDTYDGDRAVLDGLTTLAEMAA